MAKAAKTSLRRAGAKGTAEKKGKSSQPVEVAAPQDVLPLWSLLLSAGVLLAATCLLFLPTIHYSLVYDDLGLIANNPRLTSWSYVPSYFTTHFFSSMPTVSVYYYRPLSLLWMRLVYAVLGQPREIWHLSSILLHMAVAASLLFLIRRLTGNLKAALLAAALFAMHPIHTEAVAWLSSSGDMLLTLFLVLCLYFYAAEDGPISFASLIFATLAMFTKETGIVVPALIFLYEWTRSSFKHSVVKALPYLVPAILFLELRAQAIHTFRSGVAKQMGLDELILAWPRMIADYLGHLIWPVHLSPSYDMPADQAIWPLLLLALACAALLWAGRSWSPNARFGALWFALTLLPALATRAVFADDYVHDRYLYLPTVGLALMAAVLFSRLRLTRATVAAACAVAILLCWGTRRELPIWQNEIALFQRGAETSPRNPYFKSNLAVIYLDSHREAEAFPMIQQVIALRPRDYQGYYNMFRYYQQTGNEAEADRYYAIFQQILAEKQARAGAR
jgi:hypothetical protein